MSTREISFFAGKRAVRHKTISLAAAGKSSRGTAFRKGSRVFIVGWARNRKVGRHLIDGTEWKYTISWWDGTRRDRGTGRENRRENGRECGRENGQEPSLGRLSVMWSEKPSGTQSGGRSGICLGGAARDGWEYNLERELPFRVWKLCVLLEGNHTQLGLSPNVNTVSDYVSH